MTISLFNGNQQLHTTLIKMVLLRDVFEPFSSVREALCTTRNSLQACGERQFQQSITFEIYHPPTPFEQWYRRKHGVVDELI